MNERPITKTNYEIYEERDNLEAIAARVIEDTFDTVYTGLDPGGVELKMQVPELSDDWIVPELSIEEKDELHEVLTSENLTPHVTTTLTVDESEKFLLDTEDELGGLDKARVAETTTSIDNITDKMFSEIEREHIDHSNQLMDLEEEMYALAETSKNASVEELIQIADRIAEIEVILGNISSAPVYTQLKPITVLKPIGE